ncbi:MAG: dihydroorotate dehydrogenase-like protein [Caldilineales bacterium]|nr:dihydroorotate dehydrogenase-like protein [Caldilineales bacterium]
MTDLTTTYMGMTLKNPIVPSASPLSYTLAGMRQLEDAGAAAVVMHSLFEEQILQESHHLDHYLHYGIESYAEALNYFPEQSSYSIGPDEYLNLIAAAQRALDIPIIASLNGVSSGGWVKYAQYIEQAGADGLELNIYYIPTDPAMTGAAVEEMYVNVVRDVRQSISIPLAVKISPYFSATANICYRLAAHGANALVLFNRFYQPDFDLEQLEVAPHLVLSTPFAMRVALRWVAILYGRVQADYAITNGVRSSVDVLKAIMAGANVAMMASELLEHGLRRIGEIEQEMRAWMEAHEYESVQMMRGSMSQQHVAEPAAFERANYMKVLRSWRPDPAGVLF